MKVTNTIAPKKPDSLVCLSQEHLNRSMEITVKMEEDLRRVKVIQAQGFGIIGGAESASSFKSLRGRPAAPVLGFRVQRFRA